MYQALHLVMEDNKKQKQHNYLNILQVNIFPLILICWELGPEISHLSVLVPNKTFLLGT
jgi:hypothetical protein